MSISRLIPSSLRSSGAGLRHACSGLHRQCMGPQRSGARLPLFAVGFALLVTSGCGAQPRSLVLLDSVSRAPVPGALVYSPGELTVHRSDVHGAVRLPAGYGTSGIHIFAKNYRSRTVQPFDQLFDQPFEQSPDQSSDPSSLEVSGEVLLTYDESLVNPVEGRLVFEMADSLRGSYGPFRENNDLLSYDLNIKVDVEEKFLSGWNTIRFKMVEDGSRIQLDLFENMSVDSILLGETGLAFSREFNAVFVDFPTTLVEGEEYSIDFHYSGHPEETGRFGGFTFAQDSLGNPWIFTACQGIGASVWWPNKDQQPDEVEEMTINVTVPSELVDVSNGRLMEVRELGNGTTEYRWKVHYPINNYSVSVNIGTYAHFSDTLGALTLDFYALPYHVREATEQFAQAKPMLQCFSDRFGEYPFMEDGYKLVEVPYSGMEHQSAVTYGNLFRNGYLGRDWTGVDISTRFDFIIIHESGHEWFGNSVTANDVSDAWIHEGWDTWAEAVYVECLWGYEDAMTYVNGYKDKVGNRAPIIGPTGVNHWPTQDQYFKGALFMNTLRHVVDDDEAWWALVREYALFFQYQNIWTTDVINFFNTRLERDFRPIFQQYLYYPSLPVLQVSSEGDSVSYRWRADVEDFDMPLKVRANGTVHTIHPTSEWQSETLDGARAEEWQPATDLFYIEVERMEAPLTRSIFREPYATTSEGDTVHRFTLTNPNGLRIRAISYGGIITSLETPDRDGEPADIVLGHDDLQGYLDASPYFGAIVGRYGNRIAGAEFEIEGEGEAFTLAANDGDNHLHGGIKGFDKVLWSGESFTSEGGVGVVFSYTSPDGEEGYPGTLQAQVTYTLTDTDELVVDYLATTDRPTPVNLTQHSYFNLAGPGSGDILGHQLMIAADHITPVDATLIPTGELSPVEATPFDFRTPHEIGERIGADDAQIAYGGGYDHNFVLNGTPAGAGVREGAGPGTGAGHADEAETGAGPLFLAAEVFEPTSGRTLQILTTEPGIQFYSGNFLDGSITGKDGVIFGHRTGFCLETQHYPDSPNQEGFPSTILRPGEEYRSRTVFRFGVRG